MRVIKFRGWNAKQKRMFSCAEMVTDQMTLLPDGRFINVSSSSTRLSVIYPSGKFIPLQFTGLLDRNGVEIYEGDILGPKLYRGITDYNFQVIFKDGSFKLSGKLSGFKTLIESLSYARKVGNDYEVIGNIYENPELTNNPENQED